MRTSNVSGFTLIELLVAIGIMAILGASLVRGASGILSQSYFANSVERIAHTLRTAQIYSIGGKEDSSWGVHWETGEITLFKGTDWSARDSSFDASSDLPAALIVTGWNDIYFDPLRGIPSSTLSVLIEFQGRIGTISVGAQGAINRP